MAHDRLAAHGVQSGGTLSVRGVGGEPEAPVGYPSQSSDGRLLMFVSAASNLVDGDDYYDIYVRDRDTGDRTCQRDRCGVGSLVKRA